MVHTTGEKMRHKEITIIWDKSTQKAFYDASNEEGGGRGWKSSLVDAL
jgi:hypothetical protein